MSKTRNIAAMLLGTGLLCGAAPAYRTLRLTGFNADCVATPGEAPSAGNFYSEEMSLQGGLPTRIKGILSDVPYAFADFTGPNALLLSAGAPATLTFESSLRARTLWVLATSMQESSTVVTATVIHADGSREAACAIEVGPRSASSHEGTAFWQLGTTGSEGSPAAATECRTALYEIPVQVSAATSAVSAIEFATSEEGKSVAIFAVTSSGSSAPAKTPDRKLFFLSDSHLDTQWNWTVRQTIDEYIKNTLTQNFDRFADSASPNFQFNFEGAIKYMWAKEYYPALYTRLKQYVKDGKWHLAGASVDANDVNVGSAEAQMRNYLYGQMFFLREFGERGGRDVMLPDCFGFPWSVPTIAAHCGMRYFHTNKLAWNSAWNYSKLPRFARWQGPDGAEIMAVVKTNPYDDHEVFRKDMSNDAGMLSEANDNFDLYSIPAAVKYVGPRSDRGGGLDKESADWVSKSIDANGPLSVSMGSTTGVLDQVFHMADYNRLPVINKGLPMRAHGVGAYTSRTMLKYWMRKGELLGINAEKASVAANWLGALPYQHQTLTDAWVRLLWHQFHDDIPGTSIEAAYKYTVNDQVLNQLDFSRTLNNAVGAVAANLNTAWADATPVVVYNPLSIERTDLVEATVQLPAGTPGVAVTDSKGTLLTSQILSQEPDGLTRILFAATVPPVGYATFNVAPSAQINTAVGTSPLSISVKGMESDRFLVALNSNGDVSSIVDKSMGNKELLKAPVRLAMLYDESLSWPSWEIHGDQLQDPPREYVDGSDLSVEVAENGPLRVALKVTRKKNGSTFVQYIRLASAGAAGRIDFVNEVDWQSRERMLKAVFPLTASNPKATYDLSIGVDVNANSMNYSTDINSSDAVCEFLGHRWADVTDRSGAFGVSVLNDCKYGWDKQTDNELRLTLIHTPRANAYSYQAKQDLGLNRFTYSIFPHSQGWGAQTQWESDRLNEPMLAYTAPRHEGALGREFAFVKSNNDAVAVKAVKRAEMEDATVVRVFEITGQEQTATLEFPSAILEAKEINGVEEHIGSATFSGNTLSFSLGGFAPKSFMVKLAPPALNAAAASEAPSSASVVLPYNVDAMCPDTSLADAETPKAFPAELVSDVITADGIAFNMGSRAAKAKNAVSCKGQTIKLPASEGARKLYLLASSLNPEGSEALFTVDGKATTLRIEAYDGNVGVFANSAETPKTYRMENSAFTASHLHLPKTGKHGIYDYLYMYKYAVALPEGARELTLPNNEEILIYAATLSNNVNDDTRAASTVVSVLDHTDTPNPFIPAEDMGKPLTPESVTASSFTNSAEAPEFAADGNPDTKWCAAASGPKWLEYRFEKPVTITGWRVENAGKEGDNWISGEYTLQRLTDGGWVNVDFVTDNTDNITNRTLSSPIVTSGVRLLVLAGEGNGRGSTARIYGFDVYGRTATPDDASIPHLISRRPHYGYGKLVTKIKSCTGRVNPSEDASKMLDGDPDTKWCYNGSVAMPEAVVELSDTYLLSRFDIHDCGTRESWGNSSAYSIEVSTDGVEWTTAVSRSDVASEDVHTATLSTPVAARYVRLKINKGGGNAVRIYAFDIWGTLHQRATREEGKSLATCRPVIGAHPITDLMRSPMEMLDGNASDADKSWFIARPSDKNAWAVIDLEEACELTSFTLSAVPLPSAYNIYVSDVCPTTAQMDTYRSSNGGANWQQVATVTGSKRTVTLSTPATGRYVKLEIPVAQLRSDPTIREFEIFGTPLANGATLPAALPLEVFPTTFKAGTPVTIRTSAAEGSYLLTSASGVSLAMGTLNSTSTPLSTSTLAPGLYLLQISLPGGTHTAKLLVY